MLPLVIVAVLGASAVYFLTKPKASPTPESDPGAYFGFVAIPIPDSVKPEPATAAERAALKPFDRFIAFVQRPDHPKLAGNFVADLVLGDTVNASFISYFAHGKGWTDAEPLPAVGEKFSFPKSFVYYVYAEGEPTTDAATKDKAGTKI